MQRTLLQRTVALIALFLAGLATAESRPPRFDPAHPPHPGDEGVFYGQLIRVKDGDSLVVKVQGVAMDFRLADLDAPELDQPYGRDAKQELASLAAGGQLVLLPIDTDRYGRTVAHAWNGATYLNEEMMKRGAGWFYTAFADNEALYLVEQEARNAKRGLWALPLKKRIEPWLWRERGRAEKKTPAPRCAGGKACVKVFYFGNRRGHPLLESEPVIDAGAASASFRRLAHR